MPKNSKKNIIKNKKHKNINFKSFSRQKIQVPSTDLGYVIKRPQWAAQKQKIQQKYIIVLPIVTIYQKKSMKISKKIHIFHNHPGPMVKGEISSHFCPYMVPYFTYYSSNYYKKFQNYQNNKPTSSEKYLPLSHARQGHLPPFGMEGWGKYFF